MNEIINQIATKYLEISELLKLKPEYFCVLILLCIWIVLYILRGVSFFRFLMRWYQRIIVFSGLCAFGVWLFYVGREHQIFLDNRTIEQVNVSINGGETAELMERDRDMRKSVGPEFEIKAEVLDEDGEIINTVTKTIHIGFSKDIMIKLPELVSGNEDFIVPAPK